MKTTFQTKKHKQNYYLLLSLFLLSLIWIYLTHFYTKSYYLTYLNSKSIIQRETNINNNYQFINPLLECNTTFNFSPVNELEKKIKDYVNKSKFENKINDVWIFFRILKNGSIISINQEQKFISASLLKLPLAIAYYKLYEDNKIDILNETIKISSDFKSSTTRNIWKDNIVPWNEYNINYLIEEMLKNSDNTAAEILYENIWWNIKPVYDDLWIKWFSIDQFWINYISVKDLASFMRILYNWSYLNKANSENLLKILSETNFFDWLRSYNPNKFIISDKFWERWFDDNEEKQLHDCWIVYKTNNPYLLCIMTKWKNFSELKSVIQEVSKIVYDDLNK